MITQEFKGFATAPPGNTGLKCQGSLKTDAELKTRTVRVDWLTVTFKPLDYQDFLAVADFIASFLDDKYVFYPERGIKRGKWWPSSGQSVRGTLLGYTFPEGLNKPGEALISISSDALCAASSQRAIWRMCRGLSNRWNVRCSRFDIALDDYEKTLSYETVVSAAEKGDYARADKYIPMPGELLRGADPSESANRGWTIYFGSRKSDKFIRYYNKAFKSGGLIDSYRWEVEFKKDRSDILFQEFISIPPEQFTELAPMMLANYVIGAIDFIDRQSGDRLSRQQRLAWWERFCKKIGDGLRLPSRQSKPLITKKIAWMKRSVETTLALLQDALGVPQFAGFLRECIVSGRERYKPEHIALLEIFHLETTGASP